MNTSGDVLGEEESRKNQTRISSINQDIAQIYNDKSTSGGAQTQRINMSNINNSINMHPRESIKTTAVNSKNPNNLSIKILESRPPCTDSVPLSTTHRNISGGPKDVSLDQEQVHDLIHSNLHLAVAPSPATHRESKEYKPATIVEEIKSVGQGLQEEDGDAISLIKSNSNTSQIIHDEQTPDSKRRNVINMLPHEVDN